jgi:hypothetical protein
VNPSGTFDNNPPEEDGGSSSHPGPYWRIHHECPNENGTEKPQPAIRARYPDEDVKNEGRKTCNVRIEWEGVRYSSWYHLRMDMEWEWEGENIRNSQVKLTLWETLRPLLSPIMGKETEELEVMRVEES